jgi:hypothetical protein
MTGFSTDLRADSSESEVPIHHGVTESTEKTTERNQRARSFL